MGESSVENRGVATRFFNARRSETVDVTARVLGHAIRRPDPQFRRAASYIAQRRTPR